MLCGSTFGRDFDQKDITNFITKKQNFYIALYNEDILDTSIEIPFVGKAAYAPAACSVSGLGCGISLVMDESQGFRPSQ